MNMGGEEFVPQQADMVQVDPFAVNDRVLTQGTFDLKAQFFHHPENGRVVGADVGPDLLNVNRLEAPLEQDRVDLGAEALAPEILFADDTVALGGFVFTVDIDQAGDADGDPVQRFDEKIRPGLVGGQRVKPANCFFQLEDFVHHKRPADPGVVVPLDLEGHVGLG